MLSRNGGRQPLTRYRGAAKNVASSSTHDKLCNLCLESPFGSSVTNSYKDAWASNSGKVSITYGKPARDLWKAALIPCPWCELIAEAIVTSLRHDEAMLLLTAMQENGSSEDDEESNSGSLDDLEELGEGEGAIDNDDDNENGTLPDLEEGNPFEEYFQKQPRFLGSLGGDSERYSKLDSAATCHVTVSYVSDDKESVSGYNTMEICIEIASVDPSDPLAGLAGERAVGFMCDLQAELGSLAGKYISSRPFNKSLTLDTTVDQANGWLDNCRKHDACLHTGGDFTPTRVIDVQDLSRPRLHIAGPEEKFDYVALSYVWGLNQLYVTTLETIQEKITGLETALLPATITDAMRVTEALGYQYLWVDSLCIIQDSREDKRHEISQMRLIFQHAALTIAAARSHSVEDGFLGDIDPPRYFLEPFDLPFYCPTGDIGSVTVSYKAGYVRGNDPWNFRAWTLEEQLLSRRLLIYSNSGLRWLCRQDSLQQEAPFGISQPFILLPWSSGGESHDLEPEELRELWCNILCQYTQRDVTNSKDKLVAFAAVAEEFHRVCGGDYLAGLWREYLFMDLQWQRDLTSEINPLYARPSEYRAPSWSWAAVNGYTFPPDLEAPRELAFSEILDCTVEPESQALPFGAVTNGILTIKGPLACGILSYPDSAARGCDAVVLAVKPARETVTVVAEVSLDAIEPSLDEVEGGIEVYCLPLAIAHNLCDEVEGLLLLPVQDGKYRRIGFFRGCRYPEWFSSLVASDLTIV